MIRSGYEWSRRMLLRHASGGIRRRLLSSSSTASPTTKPPPTQIPQNHPGVGKMMSRAEYQKRLERIKKAKGQQTMDEQPMGKSLFIRAGLPFVLFSLGAWWVVMNAIDGKLKERAMARREVSQSERQKLMEEEHDNMMDKLNKAAKKDFDNTKRIERPEEILARRRAEREKRNAWYRRYWRWMKGES